jgi:hypothetical protein
MRSLAREVRIDRAFRSRLDLGELMVDQLAAATSPDLAQGHDLLEGVKECGEARAEKGIGVVEGG